MGLLATYIMVWQNSIPPGHINYQVNYLATVYEAERGSLVRLSYCTDGDGYS